MKLARRRTNLIRKNQSLPELIYPSLGGTNPSDALYYWYAGDGVTANSSLGTVTDGGLVDSWLSEGSTALNLSQPNISQQPTFRQSVPELDGLSGIEFDGDWLFAVVSGSTIASLPTYSIHMKVANSVQGAGYIYTEGRTSNASHKIWTGFGSSNLTFRQQGGSSATASGSSYVAAQSYVLTFAKHASNDWRIYRNGTQVATSVQTPGTVIDINRITIGALITADVSTELVTTAFLGWVNTVIVMPNLDNLAGIATGLGNFEKE